MTSLKCFVSILTALSVIVLTFACIGLVPVSAEVTAPEGYEIAEQIKIDFNTEGMGWSGNSGDSTNVSQVTDPDDSSNCYMQLSTPKSDGFNFEIANGSNSNTAYEMVANTKYSIEFKFKVISITYSSKLSLCFGTKAAYNSALSKPYITNWTPSGYNDGEWHTVSYSWTTTETMLANTYTDTTNTNLCNRLYLVARGTCSYYIDDIVITKYKEISTAPKNQITYINFDTEGKGWSDYNGTFGTNINQVTDPDDGTNKYMTLYSPNGNGYNMELATGSSSSVAYTLEKNTKYQISLKLMPIQAYGNLALFVGSKSASATGHSKYLIKSWKNTSYTVGEWHTVTYEFTTTETMSYDSYNGSGNTNICDRLYLVARGTESKWAIDDVEIKKYVDGATEDEYVDGIAPGTGDGTGDGSGDGTGDGSDEENTQKEMYSIPDFTHEPYLTYAAPNTHSGTWYCSVRWSTYTENNNSVMRYKFEYDIAEDAPSTSGERGTTAKGTNGATSSSMCLVPTATPKTPITLTAGKSYKITFKYKVLAVELNSYVSFGIMRGKYSSSWTQSYGVSTTKDKENERYIIAVEYGPTNDWVEASYTFTADYSTYTDFDKLQIGGKGYGDALIDDIVVQEIDASEVEPPNNDSTNYTYTTSGNTSTITSYKANATDLTITTLIGRRHLVEIGEYAFLYNRYTKNIIIENGPTTIGNYAFEYAKVLETISLPASITSIGKGAFYGIKTMKSFTVDAANENFASVDGVLYTKDMKTLLYYPAAKDATTFTVPASVTTIAEGAFLNATKLQTIVLPEGLTTIERRAFMNCTALTSINIPSTVTSVGSSALRNCSSLTADGISIADELTVGENAFADSATYTVGSTSGDTTVDVQDATLLAKHLAGFKNSDLGRFGELAADINGDGNVDMLDAVLLKRHLAGWKGYKSLPYTGFDDTTYEEYTTDSTTPELVVNLSEQNSRKVTPKRDINYDPNKEDVIILLITGQSNSGTGGYRQEYQWKNLSVYPEKAPQTHPDWEITAEPTRPDEGTVFFGATVTELSSSNDVYYKTDAASLGDSTMGGYSPAMGKALHDATGAKIVFVHASKGSVGMHEWTPDPENYDCGCEQKGGGTLYSTAVANFTKTYQALQDDYNIVATAYVYNQGEHEENPDYTTASTCTVHDDQTYYDALLSMHNGFLSECEIDCGGMYMPRSYYARYKVTDIEQNSRRPSYARTAMYRAAQEVDNFFIFSNIAEKIYKDGELKPDPSNSIHYSMIAYNAIGAQNGDSMAKYFGFADASEFTGITVFNKIGVELCAFDVDGNLVSGSDVVEFSDDNSKLYIRINPTGTMYTLNYSSAGTDVDFVDDFGIVTSVEGQTSFKIVINPPVK